MGTRDPLAPEPPASEPVTPETDGSAPASRTRAARWPIVVAVAVALALVAAGTVTGLRLSAAAHGPVATPSPSPTRESAAPSPTPTPTPTVAPAAMPADCRGLLAGVLTDPRWDLDYERLASVPGGDGILSEDGRIVTATFAFDFLAHLMTLSHRLTCATSDNESVTTATSWITEVDGPRAEEIGRMFDASSDDYSCSDWRGGRLCELVWQTDGGDLREQHLLRDGLWVAVIQSAAVSGESFDDGYLDAIVDAVFGQGS